MLVPYQIINIKHKERIGFCIIDWTIFDNTCALNILYSLGQYLLYILCFVFCIVSNLKPIAAIMQNVPCEVYHLYSCTFHKHWPLHTLHSTIVGPHRVAIIRRVEYENSVFYIIANILPIYKIFQSTFYSIFTNSKDFIFVGNIFSPEIISL